MKTICLVIFSVFLMNINAQSPVFGWAHKQGYIYGEGQSMIADAAGNVYATGYFEGTEDFDPGAGVLNLSSEGYADIFILKKNAEGKLLWAKNIGSTGPEFGKSIAIDANANIYVAGSINGVVDFDPGAGVYNLEGRDGFILKLDAKGNFLWVKGSFPKLTTIAADPSGNVYAGGCFDGHFDVDPGPSIYNLGSSGAYNSYVLKLDTAGNFKWANVFAGSHDTYLTGLATDAKDNLYSVGRFSDQLSLAKDSGTIKLATNGGFDIFISKINTSGYFEWAVNLGGEGNDFGNAIAIDVSGNVLTTGAYTGTADFDPGAGVFNLKAIDTKQNYSSDIFISKLDASGKFVFGKSMGGPNNEMAASIATDNAGNIYTTGYYYGPADFDPGEGTAELPMICSDDIFISKLYANGNYSWVLSFGGMGACGIDDRGYAIDVDSSGNIYASGGFRSYIDFDPGAGVFFLTSNSLQDAYILKLGQVKSSSSGIILPDLNNDISIFPNPTSAVFNIRLPESSIDGRIELYNSVGKKVADYDVSAVSQVFDLSFLLVGLYIAKVVKKQNVIGTCKIIRE